MAQLVLVQDSPGFVTRGRAITPTRYQPRTAITGEPLSQESLGTFVQSNLHNLCTRHGLQLNMQTFSLRAKF